MKYDNNNNKRQLLCSHQAFCVFTCVLIHSNEATNKLSAVVHVVVYEDEIRQPWQQKTTFSVASGVDILRRSNQATKMLFYVVQVIVYEDEIRQPWQQKTTFSVTSGVDVLRHSNQTTKMLSAVVHVVVIPSRAVQGKCKTSEILPLPGNRMNVFNWSFRMGITPAKGHGGMNDFPPQKLISLYVFLSSKKYSPFHTKAFSSWLSGVSSVKACVFKYSQQ